MHILCFFRAVYNRRFVLKRKLSTHYKVNKKYGICVIQQDFRFYWYCESKLSTLSLVSVTCIHVWLILFEWLTGFRPYTIYKFANQDVCIFCLHFKRTTFFLCNLVAIRLVILREKSFVTFAKAYWKITIYKHDKIVC